MLTIYTDYLKALLKDEEGASAVEYGLILGLIAVAIVVVLTLIGTNLNTLYNTIAVKLGAAS